MTAHASTAATDLATATEFYLPELPHRLPVAYHPKAAQIEFASNGWVRQFLGPLYEREEDLLRFLGNRNGLYGPLVAPTAEDHRARDIADWYQCVTVIDDFASDRSRWGADHAAARAEFAGIFERFASGQPGEDQRPFEAAVVDLWLRISPGLSDTQQQRLVVSMAAFLDGCADEIKAKLADEEFDYETCMAVRENSFGCEFITLMTEYGAAVDMSPYRDDEKMVQLHRHAMRQMCLVNDLLSWRKERRQDDRGNAVRALCVTEGMTLQQGVDKICELVDHHERSYLAAKTRIADSTLGRQPGVIAYLDALDYVIGGSEEFEYLTPRYWGEGAVWDGTRSGWVSLTAPVTGFRRNKPAPGNTGNGIAT